MKQGWKLETVGNVCTIVNGGTPKTGVPKYWDGGHLWLTPKDMGKLASNFVSDTSRKITDEGLRNSSAKLLPIDSIVLSSRAPIGHLAINKKPISTNQGCKGLVPKNGIDTKFVFFFLKNSVELLNDLGSGTTFKELSGTKLSSIEIPIPPLPEQKRIVAKLDQAFEAIDQAKANVERNLQNAKDLFQSKLNEIFSQQGEGWVGKKLEAIYSFKNGINFDKTQKIGKGILTIDVANMYGEDMHVNTNKLYRVNKEVKEDYKLQEKDILIVRSSVKEEGVAWACYFQKSDEPITFCGFIIRGRPIAEINERYVVYYLRSQNVRKELIRNAVRSTITNINQKALSRIIIPIPPEGEQTTIVAKLGRIRDKTTTLENKYITELSFLEELKKSILQKAFNGEL